MSTSETELTSEVRIQRESLSSRYSTLTLKREHTVGLNYICRKAILVCKFNIYQSKKKNMINNGVNQKLTIICKSTNLEQDSLEREKWLKATWKFLEHGIREILNKQNEHAIQFERLYRFSFVIIYLVFL